MNEIASAIVAHGLLRLWLEAVLRVCLLGTLVLLTALVLARLLRRAQPSVRCWIWRIAILKLFVLFFCPAAIPIPILPAPSAAAAVQSDGPAGEQGLFSSQDSSEAPSVPGLKPATGSPNTGRTVAAVLTSALAVAWAAGVLFGLVRILRHYRGTKRLMLSAQPIADGAIHDALIQASRAMGLSFVPGFYMSDAIEVPLLYGLFRPVVVLPSHVVIGFSTDECGMMLAHELAHVKRNDLAWASVAGLAQTLFFFHPLVWLAHREMRMAQEVCSDELALRASSAPPHAYGDVLVRVAAAQKSQTSSPQDGLIAVSMTESFNTIQRRLEEMQTFRKVLGWRRWAPAAVVAAGGVVLLPWRLEAQLGSGQKPKDAKAVQAGVYSLRIVDPSSSGSFRASASGGGENSSFSFSSSGGFASGGTAGGGSFTFGPGGTTTSSFHSNLSLGLDISAKNRDDLLMVDGVENLRGQDDRGKAVRGPDMPSMSAASMPPMMNLTGAANPPKDASRREMLLLQTEEGAKSLKTLEGELVVTNGALRTIPFAADEVRPGASKHAGQVTVTIDSVRETDSGYEVSVSYESQQPRPAQDPREQMRRMMSANRGLQAELIGTDGETYRPMAFGGGSAGGSIFMRSSDGGFASRGGSSTSRLNLTFAHMPGDAQPKSLVFRTVERLGEPRRIPFKFVDVPVGAGR